MARHRGRVLTDDEALEEEVDPSHDKHLGHHVGQLLLHAFHHALHHFRVHRVRCLLLAILVLEVLAALVSVGEHGLARAKRVRWDIIAKGAQTHTTQKSFALADGLELRLLGLSSQEHRNMVAKNAHKHHDNHDGYQNPVPNGYVAIELELELDIGWFYAARKRVEDRRSTVPGSRIICLFSNEQNGTRMT